jgi:hypothetical protein
MKLTREQLAVRREIFPYEKRSPALLALGEESSHKRKAVHTLENRINFLQMQITSEQALLKLLQARLPEVEKAYERAFKVYLAMKKKDLEEKR